MAQRALVVTFHGIGEVPRGVPEDERPYWATISDFEALVPEILSVARRNKLDPLFTFDDGNQSDIEIAAPKLLKYNAKAIFFPCAGRIGSPGYLDEYSVRSLIGSGFDVGSHGWDHRPWPTLDRSSLRHEIKESKIVLEGVAGQPIRSAAVPFGAYRRRVLLELWRAGYKSVYSSDPGIGRVGQWLSRRFSYRRDQDFDPARLVWIATNPSQRLLQAGKRFAKAIR